MQQISMPLNQVLRDARTKAGLSIKKMAEKAGVSGRTISNYESGDTFPPFNVIETYAEINNVSASELLQPVSLHAQPISENVADEMGELTEPTELAESIELPGRTAHQPARETLLPVIALVAAGRMEFTDQGWGADASDQWLSRPYGFLDKNAYACRVEGDSMMPYLMPGMLIVASPNIPIENIANGDLVIVKTSDMNVSVKVLHRSKNSLSFESWNEKYDTIHTQQEDVVFIHKVVWIRAAK